eukprot:TRINITY_DN411_c0_g1_i1.p1 TRINITY_DN411_c0_g1~~TRINITY_DN411_c0_g1_i1.p1  ORF type:complete len:546 (-),score=290.79 TRINITY_DN411_c0_g1_i1:212-1849(-)
MSKKSNAKVIPLKDWKRKDVKIRENVQKDYDGMDDLDEFFGDSDAENSMEVEEDQYLDFRRKRVAAETSSPSPPDQYEELSPVPSPKKNSPVKRTPLKRNSIAERKENERKEREERERQEKEEEEERERELEKKREKEREKQEKKEAQKREKEKKEAEKKQKEKEKEKERKLREKQEEEERRKREEEQEEEEEEEQEMHFEFNGDLEVEDSLNESVKTPPKKTAKKSAQKKDNKGKKGGKDEIEEEETSQSTPLKINKKKNAPNVSPISSRIVVRDVATPTKPSVTSKGGLKIRYQTLEESMEESMDSSRFQEDDDEADESFRVSNQSVVEEEEENGDATDEEEDLLNTSRVDLEDEDGPRRSKRKRSEPLEWWRHEGPVYSSQNKKNEDDLPSVVKFVKRPKTPIKHKKERFQLPLEDKKMKLPQIEMEDNDGTTVFAPVAKRKMQFEPTSFEKISVSAAFRTQRFNSGMLILPAGATHEQTSEGINIFVVQLGCVKVTLADSKYFALMSGDTCWVPENTVYKIVNMDRNYPSKISFTTLPLFP